MTTIAKQLLNYCERHEATAKELSTRRKEAISYFAYATRNQLIDHIYSCKGPELPRTYNFEIPSELEDKYGKVEVDEEMRLALGDHFTNQGFDVWVFEKLKRPSGVTYHMELSWAKAE